VETEVGEPHRIAPVGGRLVLFRSAMAHEVSRHESSHDRIALTVWIGGVAWGS